MTGGGSATGSSPKIRTKTAGAGDGESCDSTAREYSDACRADRSPAAATSCLRTRGAWMFFMSAVEDRVEAAPKTTELVLADTGLETDADDAGERT